MKGPDMTEEEFIALGVQQGWLKPQDTPVVHMVPIGEGRMARSGITSTKRRHVTEWKQVEAR